MISQTLEETLWDCSSSRYEICNEHEWSATQKGVCSF